MIIFAKIRNMKTNHKISVMLVGIALAFSFVACERESIIPPHNENPTHGREIQDAHPAGDFAFLRAIIGMEKQEAINYLTQHGYVENESNSYNDTEADSITKRIGLNYINDDVKIPNASMVIGCEDFDTLSIIFKKWLLEFRNSDIYPIMVRTSYNVQIDNDAEQHIYSLAQLIEILPTLHPTTNAWVNFYGNDNLGYQYYFDIYWEIEYSTFMGMQIINERVNNPLPDVQTVNLTEDYLNKDILIAKVDYMTFEYRGFYSMNVTNKLNEGNEIPFIADYMSPGDDGYIKLYYRDESNLLMDGDIMWMGCGELHFPETFVKGNSSGTYTPEFTQYPGNEKISFINDYGNYTTEIDLPETDLHYVWQTLSDCEEFMSYYNQTYKKVAVYPYTPSVGVGDPYDWYYLVFVER